MTIQWHRIPFLSVFWPQNIAYGAVIFALYAGFTVCFFVCSSPIPALVLSLLSMLYFNVVLFVTLFIFIRSIDVLVAGRQKPANDPSQRTGINIWKRTVLKDVGVVTVVTLLYGAYFTQSMFCAAFSRFSAPAFSASYPDDLNLYIRAFFQTMDNVFGMVNGPLQPRSDIAVLSVVVNRYQFFLINIFAISIAATNTYKNRPWISKLAKNPPFATIGRWFRVNVIIHVITYALIFGFGFFTSPALHWFLFGLIVVVYAQLYVNVILHSIVVFTDNTLRVSATAFAFIYLDCVLCNTALVSSFARVAPDQISEMHLDVPWLTIRSRATGFVMDAVQAYGATPSKAAGNFALLILFLIVTQSYLLHISVLGEFSRRFLRRVQ